MSTLAFASSHREGPSIAMNPTVDATDLYMFRSYETGRQDFVTLIANYMPLQDAYSGPNFHQFNPDALYEIHIDNNGDAKPDITFQFRFENTSKGQALNIGGKQVKIPLMYSNQLEGRNPAALNVRETYTAEIIRGDSRTGTRASLTSAAGAIQFDKPIDNVGDKTFKTPTGYQTYAGQHIYAVNIPGCGTGRMFVGQRKEPFHVALGKIFDLFNLNPLGAETGNTNDLEDKNISSLALEVPIACLTAGNEPVIGGFTTASLRQGTLIDPSPKTGLGNATVAGGAWTQVSRLGMPLVNEVVIGIDDKDKFNASKPADDGANFADYVTNPVLPALVETLFPSAKAPTNFPRTDLVTAFLTGIEGVNKPKTVTASEMMRLNTAIAPTVAASQNPLGVAGGDLAGFPNGRRPADDVVDVSLRVAMGALCVLTGDADALKVGCKPSDAPAGGLALTDGVRKTAGSFDTVFPYLTTPLPGASSN
ncbi:MAG: DUF4331 domain-containing protein [Lautropia sp.]